MMEDLLVSALILFKLLICAFEGDSNGFLTNSSTEKFQHQGVRFKHLKEWLT